MAPNHDEQMNQRRARREELRRKRRAEQRRMMIGLIAAAVVLVLGGIWILKISRDPKPLGSGTVQNPNLPQPTVASTAPPVETTKPARGYQEPITINIKVIFLRGIFIELNRISFRLKNCFNSSLVACIYCKVSRW